MSSSPSHQDLTPAADTAMSRKRTLADLARDDGGVIMIVGVFFTFFWIGMIWYLFGIGNVIAYRENMQNAADAAAFAGAVYDARGMNLIALINNLMGITLALLLIMKVAQVANLFAKGADCHQAEETDLGLIADPWTTLEGLADIIPTVAECVSDCDNVLDFRKKIDSYDQTLHTALNVMHTAETLIAVNWGWPTVAQGKSEGVAGYYFGNGTGASAAGANSGVTGSTSWSYSQQLQSSDPNATSSAGSNTCPSFPVNADGTPKGGTTGDGLCAIGPRCGLPVTSDSYGTVCTVSIDDWTTLGQAFQGLDAAGSIFGNGLHWAIGEWLCDDDTMTGLSKFTNEYLWNVVGTLAVSVAAFWECTLVNGIGEAITALLKGGGGATEGSLSLIPMSGPPIPATCPAWSTMRIYQDNSNNAVPMGTDYYSVWGVASGTYTDVHASRVQISALEASDKKTVGDVPGDAVNAVARAEFYYDPQGTAGSPAGGETVTAETVLNPNSLTGFNIQYNVLWNMRWRARLRRFHFMPTTAYLGDGAGVGSADYAVYIARMIANPSAVNLAIGLGLTGDAPSVSLINVGSETNKAPYAMFH